MNKIILPGSTIGIIGGGQLGRMLTIAAKQMGYKIAVLDPNINGPCYGVADINITANYSDKDALKKLLEISDVVTYEFENVPGFILEDLDEYGYIPQGFRPLVLSQNRGVEKKAIESCGFKTAPYELINNDRDLYPALNKLGFPAILKTCTGGYDGKGQVLIKNKDDIKNCFQFMDNPCILEAFVDFKCEISAIVTRSTQGEISVFPISENLHQNNILHQSIVPARINEPLKQVAKKLAIDLIKGLDFVGTLAVELFVTTKDDLLVNEIAPRPHNSGHYTIEACETSQFEQHIRAICGLTLGSTRLKQNAIMVNILGQNIDLVSTLIQMPLFKQAKLHLYEKDEIKRNRKMGHITFLDNSQTNFLESIKPFLLKLKGE